MAATERTPQELEDARRMGILLERLAGRVGVGAVDELWVFPRRGKGAEHAPLLVIAAFDEAEDRRRVITARTVLRVPQGKKKEEERTELVEHGALPADRLGRLVEGVVRRLDDAVAEDTPRSFTVGGDAERWGDLRRELVGGEGSGTEQAPEAGGPAAAAAPPPVEEPAGEDPDPSHLPTGTASGNAP